MNRQCPSCRAHKATISTCKTCGGKGSIKLTTCPLEFVGDEVLDNIHLTQLADKGSWPVTGGVLDQSDAFLQFQSAWHAALKRAGAE